MIARHASIDVNVIGLIGERGREVREFVERDLGPEGLARSVVVEKHRGQLFFESEAGQGTTFHVRLPLPGAD